MGQWSIEDASIYQPFWFFFVILAAEVKGAETDLLDRIQSRFYLESWRHLIMPDGQLPDWGDGDWTHSWEYYVANAIKGGSAYRDGRHYEFARRVYLQYKDKRWTPWTTHCIAAALRWIDVSVPVMPYQLAESEEVVDDLVSKKIVFRNDNAENSAYLLLNYRDQGPFARYSRDYLNQQLAAYEEKAHHGHADENSVNVFMTDRTLLLFDGGYRRSPFDGWRADFYHNRVVARWGWPVTLPQKGDLLDHLAQNKVYHDVRTEKIHFGTFGSIDYSRTRLIDDRLGYEGDRLVIFVPETSMAIVVDTILNNEPGQKCFANVWLPYKIVKNGNLKGENEHYVLSWPPNVPIRPRSEADTNELWPNVHHADLLVQFLANRDKQTCVDTIERRFLPSDIVYQYEFNYYFAGQRLLFITVLRPHPSDGFDPDMLDNVTLHGDYLEERRYLGLAFEINGEPVTVALKLDQNIGLTNYKGRPMFDWRTGSRKYGNLETDADFAFVRERDDAFEFGMLYGCRLSYRDRTLFEMPLNTHMFQGATDYQVPEIRDKMPRYRDSVKK